MNSANRCTRHVTAIASFVCDRCGEPFCPECRCELLDGDVCCTECAVEAAGENGGEFGVHHGVGHPDVARPMKKRNRSLLIMVVLLVGFPILVAELLFLHRSTVVGSGPEAEVRRVMGDTLVLVTELNRYRARVGSYPERLELMVPSNWDPGDMAELESYEYRRIGSDHFALLPRLTGDVNQDAGIVLALELIPSSFGEDSSLEIFLQPQQHRERLSTAGGES